MDTATPYYTIITLSVLITGLSMVVEKQLKIIKEGKNLNNIVIAICRFFHFGMFFYFSLFALVFPLKDGYVYMVLALTMMISWYIHEYCIINYYELKYGYDVDHTLYLTTFHPPIYSLCQGEHYSNIAMNTMGVCMVLNTSYIVYSLKAIPIGLKLLYVVLFGFFLVDSVLKNRIGGGLKYNPKPPPFIVC